MATGLHRTGSAIYLEGVVEPESSNFEIIAANSSSRNA
jgi:hypothetical protein